MTVTATIQDDQIVLRSYDTGECFAITLRPVAALILAADLLSAAITVQQRSQGAVVLEPQGEQGVAGGEHNGNR